MKADLVVNKILELSIEKKISIRNMKMQKLLWFINGWYSLWYDKEGLFPNEFEAWPYGPVIPEVYHEFKKFSLKPIDRFMLRNESRYFTTTDEDIENTSNEVMDYYGEYSDLELSELTHEKDGAWIKAYSKNRGEFIDQNDIYEEFKSLQKRLKNE